MVLCSVVSSCVTFCVVMGCVVLCCAVLLAWCCVVSVVLCCVVLRLFVMCYVMLCCDQGYAVRNVYATLRDSRTRGQQNEYCGKNTAAAFEEPWYVMMCVKTGGSGL